MATDTFKEEYDRLNAEIEEQLRAGAYAQSNITNITNMILIPHYEAEAQMKWQKVYPPGSPELQQKIQQAANDAKLWTDTYVDHTKALRIRRPYNNPEDPAWDILESDIAFIQKNYPDIPKNIGAYVDDLINSYLAHEQLKEDLNELMKGSQEKEEPVVDTATEMSNIEQRVETQVETVTKTPESSDHVYPVALVQSWTNEMKNYKDQLVNYMGMLDNVNFDKVDRMWLKNQVMKFIDWLNKQLAKIRKKIIKALKGMMQPIKKAMGLISPILSLPGDPLAILGWAGNVVSFVMEPYQKIIQFISDFSSYTPPLVSAAVELAGTAATVPSTITTKIDELKGEGSELIIDEITNAVQGVAFKPISMGDVMA